jgi:hypothetical protein
MLPTRPPLLPECHRWKLLRRFALKECPFPPTGQLAGIVIKNVKSAGRGIAIADPDRSSQTSAALPSLGPALFPQMESDGQILKSRRSVNFRASDSSRIAEDGGDKCCEPSKNSSGERDNARENQLLDEV